MRFSLRSLLIALLLMPPLAAGVWREIAKRQVQIEIEEGSWADVGGPGFINGFETTLQIEPEEERTETATDAVSLEAIDNSEKP